MQILIDNEKAGMPLHLLPDTKRLQKNCFFLVRIRQYSRSPNGERRRPGPNTVFNIEPKDHGDIAVGTGYVFISQPRQLFMTL